MRAVVYRQFGPSSVLEVREIDEPHPGDGQVRIRVGASSVNPIDGKVRAGFLAKVIPVHFPAQAGFDAAGIVDEVGVGVEDVTTGDRLFGMTAGGGAAEFAVLQAWAPTPPNTPDTVAAAAALAGITAVKAVDQLQLHRPARLLIIGAGGAVGSIAVQVAISRGHEVTGVASPDDQTFIEQQGGRFAVTGPGLAARLRKSGATLFDAVLDATSAGALEELAGLVLRPANVLAIAARNAAEFGARTYDGQAGDWAGPLHEIADLLARETLHIRVVSTLPLDRAAEAHERIHVGHVGGRIVLVP